MLVVSPDVNAEKFWSRQLISKHAWAIAAKPEMWGGCQPNATNIEKLANVFIGEWTRALQLMLRHWEIPPTITGQ